MIDTQTIGVEADYKANCIWKKKIACKHRTSWLNGCNMTCSCWPVLWHAGFSLNIIVWTVFQGQQKKRQEHVLGKVICFAERFLLKLICGVCYEYRVLRLVFSAALISKCNRIEVLNYCTIFTLSEAFRIFCVVMWINN